MITFFPDHKRLPLPYYCWWAELRFRRWSRAGAWSGFPLFCHFWHFVESSYQLLAKNDKNLNFFSNTGIARKIAKWRSVIIFSEWWNIMHSDQVNSAFTASEATGRWGRETTSRRLWLWRRGESLRVTNGGISMKLFYKCSILWPSWIEFLKKCI